MPNLSVSHLFIKFLIECLLCARHWARQRASGDEGAGTLASVSSQILTPSLPAGRQQLHC